MSSSTEQLMRLLRLIPLAARPDGIRISEAARLCGVTESQIDRDFGLLAERAWYLPPGRTDDFQIVMQGDRILVVAPPAFERPIRLGLHELLAVSLALRCAGVEREEALELRQALEAACAMEDCAGGIGGDEQVEFILGHPDHDEVHHLISRAIVHRRRVRLRYVKDAADSPEVRTVEPWHLIHAEGEVYLLAWALERSAPRLFRLDRVLSAVMTEVACTEEMSIEPADLGSNGALRLVAEDAPEEYAEVRYSPSVARWVRERFDGESTPDGGYSVQHRLLTEEWLVRHVLEFGTEAEVVRPAHLRDAVVRALSG